MAGSNEIKYKVNVDASRANRALSQFGKAATRAGKDAADAMDDTASAGDKARAALTQMAAAMDSELRDAAAAADALRTALGDAAERFDANEVVADLNRMGVTFDEIRGDADKFATTLREIDGVRVQQVNDGLDGTKRALDGVRDSSDQSRSVLANMAGNTAQDMGELAGVTGTAGVAIGQLAEYATEGNISMRQLATVAGPMAALGLVIGGITKGIQELRAQQEAWRQQQADMNDALRETGDLAEVVNQMLEENTELIARPELNWWQRMLDDLPLVTNLLDETSAETGGLVEAMAAADITQQHWTNSLTSGLGPATAMLDRIERLADEGKITGDQAELLREQWNLYSEAALTAQVNTAAVEEVMAPLPATIGKVTAAMGRQETAVLLTATHWRRLLHDLRDGNVDTERGLESWNALRDELGLTNDEMAELTQQKLAEKLEEDTAAAQELADAIAATRDSFADYNRTVRSAEFGATTFEAAETAMGTFFDLVQGGAENVVNLEEAYDNLGEAAETSNGKINFDTPEGRATYQALQSLGQTLIPDITDAFHDSQGDIGRFTGSMNDLSGRVLRRLQNELGLSQEDAQAMIVELGLVPENVETMYKLIGDEEAKAKLALLQGSIDALPDDVQTTVTQQIILGDYQGALRTVQNYYTRTGATIPVDADISRALEALRRLQAIARFSQVVVSVGGQSAASSSSSAPAAATRGVTVVPAAATPVNVTVNTSVVGNRYDLERVMSGAVRNAIRLAGRRQLVGPVR